MQKLATEFKEKNIENSEAYGSIGQEDLTGGISDFEYNNMDYLKTQIGQFTEFLNINFPKKSKDELINDFKNKIILKI